MKHAQSVHTILRIGAGELNLTGEADALMEGDFSYNVADWKFEFVASEGVAPHYCITTKTVP